MKSLFLLPALTAALGLTPAGRATAQTFTAVYSFTNGADGRVPLAALISSGNTLYGTTWEGGNYGFGTGTIFALNANGTGFTNLHTFPSTTGSAGGYGVNSDGAYPQAELLLSGNTLYGTAEYGGTSGNGTVFALNTNGTGFTNLHIFTAFPSSYYTNGDGADPMDGLILAGNTLYGTTSRGGSYGFGTVFSLNTNSMNFSNLYSFSNGLDGSFPFAGLVLAGNTLYGTATEGGSSRVGTVFALQTNGAGFATLYTFTNGDDGGQPVGGLLLSGNTLYGTAFAAGLSQNNVTVFALNTNGTGFAPLYTSDRGGGAFPYGALVLSGNTLYGTAEGGGGSSYGTVYGVTTNGGVFTNLYNFTNGLDGGDPQAGLLLLGNTLYGTAGTGGTSIWGTIFSVSLPVSPPQLNIILFGTNAILTWTNTASGFTLQSTANLASPLPWNPVSPVPVVINGQYTVTNAISGAQKFYLLSQ